MVFIRYMPRSGIAGSYDSSVFCFFEEPPYCSPSQLYQFIFLPRVEEGSLSPHHGPTQLTTEHIPGENHNSKRFMPSNDHCSTIYNCQDMKATKFLSTEKWIKKTWYKYCCLAAKLCLTLCIPRDCSPPGSSVHEIL